MRRRGFSVNALKSIDAFGKTLEDVKIRTKTGASLTIVSITLIVLLTLIEFIDYRTIYLDTDIQVNKEKYDRLTVNYNVTFPRVPCFLISVDTMDVSGEHMRDMSYNVNKIRLDKQGNVYPGQATQSINELPNELSKVAKLHQPGYCGPCYGGALPKGGCCQTCDDVRKAYEEQGWVFQDPDQIEQCVAEQWKDKMSWQGKDGCRIEGRVRIRKVKSTLSFSYGKSFVKNGYHTQELVPYLAGYEHDFGHRWEWLRFESDDEYNPGNKVVADKVKARLGVEVNPLDGAQYRYQERFRRRKSDMHEHMFNYFFKAVSNEFHTLNDEHVNSHQYSYTQHTRDVGEPYRSKNTEGIDTTHLWEARPGVFLNIDVSPMHIIHTEKRKPLAWFLTTFCAIVGGVLTVASLIDAALFNTVTKPSS